MPSYNRYYQGFLVFGLVVNPGHFQTVNPVNLSFFPFQGTCAKSEAPQNGFPRKQRKHTVYTESEK